VCGEYINSSWGVAWSGVRDVEMRPPQLLSAFTTRWSLHGSLMAPVHGHRPSVKGRYSGCR
jgi:hypothetical protein